MREEVDFVKSFVSFILVFFLLIPVITGELNNFALADRHTRLIIRKADAHTHRDACVPYELNGKEEENRSKKSTHLSVACVPGESTQHTIQQLCSSFVFPIQVRAEELTKVPRYLSQRSLLI